MTSDWYFEWLEGLLEARWRRDLCLALCFRQLDAQVHGFDARRALAEEVAWFRRTDGLL